METLASYLIDDSSPPEASPPSYYYQGAEEGARLPRTRLAEAVARGLMQRLAADARYATEGKMYGVLLVEAPSGGCGVLRAFSGLLHGESAVDGWVPMIPGREQVAQEEARVLARLAALKQALIALQPDAERQQLRALEEAFERSQQEVSRRHAARKEARAQERQRLGAQLTGEALAAALAPLDQESRQEGLERKRLRRERDEALRPLQQKLASADSLRLALRRERAEVSRQLQAQLHAHYWLTNFAGESLPLQQLMPGGSMPTGTGECCAPKLLHYAAAHALRPLAMAEFWWGPGLGGRVEGELYGACAERCQPLLSFLLSGVSSRAEGALAPLTLLYEDRWLLAVNKPAGLLSVPGRYHHNQDSVLSRLQHQRPNGAQLMAVHRLDQDTSGILLLACDKTSHHHLSQQFEQRQVRKVYEALLVGSVAAEQGTIALSLWGDPARRPYQLVDRQRGKPSETRFRVLAREGLFTRVELAPLTGRTHQLRVHAASPEGLGAPILGDRLYGGEPTAARLHLHARELHLTHPRSGETLRLAAETPF